jgi:hypothetical protein
VLFDSLDYVVDADGELRRIYEWRPRKAPSKDFTKREAAARAKTPVAGKGQGRQLDSAVRAVTESHTMTRAREHYESLGYELEDTYLIRPYDSVERRHSEVRKVEVKGSISAGLSFHLTAGKVSAARNGSGPTELFIVHSISVALIGDSVPASGGTIKLVTGWELNEKDLTPTEYRYRVP